ncbi:MAG TPA: redox-sensing transcriptional repressor Rex [Gemmatimonadales bacterium]|nr:redox-sensing transcriptional repressor Rex [Gemmatimonadales bacterium]
MNSFTRPGLRDVAASTVRRLSLYLQFLDQCEKAGTATVSSGALAERGGASPAQVRKDLSFFGSFGRRGVGYNVPRLAGRLREILGLVRRYRVVLVGAGRVGAALAAYPGFRARGFDVVAVYDADPARIGALVDGLAVRSADRVEADLAAEPADIAVIATPAEAAQGVADRLVRAGVRAFLNFAPVALAVPRGVTVSDVNMALELEALSYALHHAQP